MDEHAMLAKAIRAALLVGGSHTTRLGRWGLERRCVFMTHPRARPPGEADRDAFGRPRFSSGHWLTPLFRPSRTFRGVVQGSAADWVGWEADLVVQLRAGRSVEIVGVGVFDHITVRDRSRPRFRFDEAFRREIGTRQDDLLSQQA